MTDSIFKTILPRKYRCMLWKDELGDPFLLLKYAEVYEYSKTVLRMHIFSYPKWRLIKNMGLILNESKTDDPLWIVDVKVEKLGRLIALGAYKRRIDKNGSTMKKLEKLLAHKIIPFRPELKNF